MPPLPHYDLFAVAHHSGSAYGGHYTAHCRSPNNGQWYMFNDSRVSPAESFDIVTSTAYVLFYIRRRKSHL